MLAYPPACSKFRRQPLLFRALCGCLEAGEHGNLLDFCAGIDTSSLAGLLSFDGGRFVLFVVMAKGTVPNPCLIPTRRLEESERPSRRRLAATMPSPAPSGSPAVKPTHRENGKSMQSIADFGLVKMGRDDRSSYRRNGVVRTVKIG